MKKNFKRALALALALLMVLSLAACGKKNEDSGSGNTNSGTSNTDSGSNSGSEQLATYSISYNTWGAGTATFDLMADMVEQALDVFGANYNRASDENMADKELQNIQNFVSSGVDGIVMQVAADPVLPQAAEACEAAKIPFVLTIFTGGDEDRAEINANNDYYLGSVNADMYAEGYLIGQEAIADGMKTAVMIGGNVGDAHFEMRIDGFTKSFVEEGGGTILNEARCASPAEGQEKANAMLSATPNADFVFAMVGDYVPGTVAAMETLGLDLPIYVTNANTDAIPYIRDGTIVAATSGNDLVAAASAALLINYLDGHQILDENGNPPELKSVGFVLNTDNVDDYEALFLNDLPFTAERLKTLVWRYNPDVTYDTIVDFVENNLNLEALMADKNA